MKPKSIHSKLIPLAALVVVSQSVLAQIKSDTNSLLANATNWSVAPGTTATGTFDATISAANAASLTLGGVDLSIGRLTFGATMNGPVNIAGGNTITLNNGTAIDGRNYAQNITINAPVVITAAGNTFESDNTLATTLTFNNTITSATHPIIWRAGTGIFAGGGSYSALSIQSRTGTPPPQGWEQTTALPPMLRSPSGFRTAAPNWIWQATTSRSPASPRVAPRHPSSATARPPLTRSSP